MIMRSFFHKLYRGSREEFLCFLKSNLENSRKAFVVTANPEAFMLGERDSEYAELLLSEAATVTADGIGIVKAAEMLGEPVTERLAGVEIAEKLLEFGNSLNKSVYFFGARPEVLKRLCEVCREQYPNLKISGAADGYVKNKDSVFEEIKALSPDIVLVALGMPLQEQLIFKHLKDFSKGIFVGVGGSFDVLSGTKARAPRFFIRHNLEWAYRVLKEPKRLKRFYQNNVRFIFKINKLKKF